MRNAALVPIDQKIPVSCEVVGRYRLNMLNATTGERIGTMNTRPHDTWAMLDDEKHKRVVMYCQLASAMHAPTVFTPSPEAASDARS